MKNQRLKQFSASFLVVLSLFVSSFAAACTCSHEHKQVAEHCHPEQQDSHEISGGHNYEPSTEILETNVSQPDCCCIQSAPKVSVKIENLKIEKQFSVFNQLSRVESAFVPQTILVESEFLTRFYLTDSFYNLTPGRAPPRL
jgi:hypothetical protein